MTNKESRLLCFLIADIPSPRTESRLDHCELCRRPVYRALSSPPEPPAWCFACALETSLRDEIEISGPTAEQVEDIKKHLKGQRQ